MARTFDELERAGELDPELEAWARKRWPDWFNIGPLMPYLAQRPNGRLDEHPAYCPVHADSRPSAEHLEADPHLQAGLVRAAQSVRLHHEWRKGELRPSDPVGESGAPQGSHPPARG